jgi:hypothetical protein
MPVADTSLQFKTISDAYLGSARVPLQNLAPEDLGSCHGAHPQAKKAKAKIQFLRRVYRKNGCRPLEHRIPILLSAPELQEMFRQDKELSRSRLNESFPPEFHPEASYRLKYLYGQGYSRLAAADLFLRGSERWWCVDFYSSEGKASRRVSGLANKF